MTLFGLRTIALYAPLVALGAVWLRRRPGYRARTGALLATLWNVPMLLAVHVLATSLGWWHFAPNGALVLGMPIDVYLGWIVLWGTLPAIAAPRLALPWLVGLGPGLDLLYMPHA